MLPIVLMRMNQLDGIKKDLSILAPGTGFGLAAATVTDVGLRGIYLKQLSPLDRLKMRTRFKTLIMQAVLD